MTKEMDGKWIVIWLSSKFVSTVLCFSVPASSDLQLAGLIEPLLNYCLNRREGVSNL